MSDQPVKILCYAAAELDASIVSLFALLAGYQRHPSLATARRQLSRCLARAAYELRPEEVAAGQHLPTERDVWSFTHRGRRFAVQVVGERVVAIDVLEGT